MTQAEVDALILELKLERLLREYGENPRHIRKLITELQKPKRKRG